MDGDIARLYAEAGIEGLKPTYVMELLRLHFSGPMTIRELAESVSRTHSALSQKVAAMKAAGLVTTSPGQDARSKRVAAHPDADGLVGRLAAEWRATEAASASWRRSCPTRSAGWSPTSRRRSPARASTTASRRSSRRTPRGSGAWR